MKIKSVSLNPQITSSNPRVTSSTLRVTSSNVRVTSSTSQVYEFKSTSYEFKFMSYVIKSTSYELESTSYKLKSTTSTVIQPMNIEVNSLKISSFPKKLSCKSFHNSWVKSSVQFLVILLCLTVPLFHSFGFSWR